MRTQAHIEYENQVYHDLGISKDFYKRLIVPAVRTIKGDKCELCCSNQELNVHHQSFEEINIKTLILLCKPCHKIVHKWEIEVL